jgi:hypothetical protein
MMCLQSRAALCCVANDGLCVKGSSADISLPMKVYAGVIVADVRCVATVVPPRGE